MRASAGFPLQTCARVAVHVIVIVWSLTLAAASAEAQRPAFRSATHLVDEIRGRVTDASTGAPIAGAVVTILGADDSSMHEMRTGADGGWRIGAGTSAGGAMLRVRAIGYVQRTLGLARLEVAEAALEIALTPVASRLDQVVVTAARREQRLADVAVTTEVVSRREIEQSGASDLAAVLTEQTGIQFQAGHPTGAGVMLQGIGSERVLVLLDGQPLVGRLSGNFDIARLPTSIIERVEIVKGPQSTLYGSEAMGGVINIVTRDVPAAAWSAEAALLAGTEGRLDGHARGTLQRSRLAGSLDLGRRAVERAPGVALEHGAMAERLDAAAKLRWSPGGSTAVDASLLALDERQRWWNGTQYSFADNTSLAGRVGASMRLGRHRLASSLHISHFDHLSRASRYEQPIAGTGDRQTQRLAEAEVLLNATVADHPIDIGLEAKQDYITSSDGRIAGGTRTLHSVEPFAQLELARGRWTIAPGARLTWNEQWGAHATPKLALRWAATSSLVLRASAAAGFRAPDFKELYFDFTNDGAGYAVHGNPDLRPEHSRNVTAGAEWTASRLYARAQLFWNELRDFIETRPLSDDGEFTVYGYGNVDRGRTRGIELETGMTAGAARADASWSLLDARDGERGLPLLGRPRQSARLTLGYSVPFGLRASITGLHTGRTPMRRDERGAVTSERDAFTRVDVRLAQALPLDLELVAGADNLLDARPSAWAGSVGRQLYFGLGWRAQGARR